MRSLAIPAALLLVGYCVTPVHAAQDHEPRPGATVVQPARTAQPLQASAADSSISAVRILDNNRLGMTLSNYGFIGTNFTSRSPSFEYPLGSGHQHMVRGGPWVGALSADEDGAFVGVTTAAVDGFQGSASAGATEFTTATNAVFARSTLPNSRYFHPGAVSEMDFISRYSDRPPKRALDNNEDHRPLGIIVTQYNYTWSFSEYAHFMIFHYVLKNDGPPLRNVWFGMYDELASGNMNLQSQIPVSGTWFSKKQIGWVDSLTMATERFCLNRPIPQNCRYDLVPEVVGVKLLGVKPGNAHDTTDKHITFLAWSFSPGNTLRDEDVEKYDLMSSGLKTNLVPLPDSLAPVQGDPVTLIAVGPFTTINPGDSVSVDFAYIGSANEIELARRAVVAQRAFDLDYIVPVPPPSPHFKVVVRERAIDYYWDNSPESFRDPTSPIQQDFEGYRLYVGEERNDLRLIAQFDKTTAPNDTTGFNTGFAAVTLAQPVTIDGVTYQYKFTLNNLRDGFKYWAAVNAYDLGTRDIESLESGSAQNEQMIVPAPAPSEVAGRGVTVFPNPYRVEAAWDRGQSARDHYLWFANLPRKCALKIFTLSGDIIYETAFDGDTYDGRNARGIYRPASDLPSNLSGAMFGWDMITRQGQAAATGLYMWAVEDQQSGKRQTGKFLLVKSDREDF